MISRMAKAAIHLKLFEIGAEIAVYVRRFFKHVMRHFFLCVLAGVLVHWVASLLVHKPFNPRTFLHRVRALLDGTPLERNAA